MKTLTVFMTITHQDGRKTRPGDYVVGKNISKKDADVVCSHPRWGKMTTVESKKPAIKADSDNSVSKTN